VAAHGKLIVVARGTSREESSVSTVLEHHRIRIHGITLHVVQAGPADGAVVLLLHGFPEFWMAWSRQIDALVAHGYRVWIPDQRGYNTSDKPAGLHAYAIDELAEDVRGLIEATGQRAVHVVGHDWGGVVAWYFAARHATHVSRLTIVNAPHPGVMQAYARSSLQQLLKSWYIVFFQLPWLPEYMLRRRNCAALVRALLHDDRGACSPEELAQYRSAWLQPGALTASVNWYRAALRTRARQPADFKVTVPTLLIWGERDHALSSALAKRSIAMCSQGELQLIPTAGHWVLREAADLVNQSLLRWLRTP
jgi:pimeloyl-ACP methyl ester carboxylesterase